MVDMSPYSSLATRSTQNQTTTQQNQTGQNVLQQDMQQFNPFQQNLQGQSLGFISNILGGGNVPQNFGMPQTVYDAAFANFNKYQAPQLAAQHGSGSPVINSAMQELQLQLAGQAGQQAMGNALNAYQMAAKYAFTPIGAKRTVEDTGTLNSTQNIEGSSNFLNTGEIAANLINLLGGSLAPPQFFGPNT